jgi:VIT1/CCC1 family predicted Fe2+/Mn2+ transporter
MTSLDEGERTLANTDITQRAQYERSDLLAGGEGLRRGSEKGAAIYSVIALIVGVALSVAAIATIDNWAQWLVLGVLVAFTGALMFAVGPNRGGAGSRFKTGR